jgi:hypothetical protein
MNKIGDPTLADGILDGLVHNHTPHREDTIEGNQTHSFTPTAPTAVQPPILIIVKATGFLARRADKKLGEDVRNNLVRLFIDHSARVVRNDESEYREPRSFDYAVATVATPDLDLRFVRVRGQFSVHISAPNPYRRWDSLDSALLWLDMQQGNQSRSDIPNWGYGFDWGSLDWWSIDRFLAENWERLKAASSARPYFEHR